MISIHEHMLKLWKLDAKSLSRVLFYQRVCIGGMYIFFLQYISQNLKEVNFIWLNM